MPTFSTYVTNVPDGTTIKIVSGKLALNKDDTSLKYGSYGGATNEVYSDIVPIGGIIAWAKTIAGVPALPSNFMECDGSAVSDADSPINGQNVPDLNTTQRFLRGASSSGGTGGSDTHTLTTAELPSHAHPVYSQNLVSPGGSGSAVGMTSSPGLSLSSGFTGSGSAHNNMPTYYEVVWIIRFK